MKLLVVTQKVDDKDQLLGFFTRWLELFSHKFEKVIVICLEKGDYRLPENLGVYSLGKESGRSKLKQFFTFYFLIFNLRNSYDAVFVHMSPIWMVLGGFCWDVMNKGRYLWYTSGGITLKLKIAEKLSNKIFTASPESFRLRSKKVVVTGHGIDTDFFKPKEWDREEKMERKKLNILSVGRISPVKNYDMLIDAAKILKQEGIDFEITMIGEAPLMTDKDYELRIKNKVKDLGLESHFIFVGKINHRDLPKYYQSKEIFVHLSKTGSLDKAILEAMACGMTVLSSSEVARSFLPCDLIVKDGDVVGLLKGLKVASQTSYGQILRNYVLENHNLDKLIVKISKIIQL